MEVREGEVVLVAFGQRRRPAVVVNSDASNSGEVNVVPLTANSSKFSKHILIEMSSPEGQQGGLRFDTIVDCSVLAAVPKNEIVGKLGKFPDEIIRRIKKGISDNAE